MTQLHLLALLCVLPLAVPGLSAQHKLSTVVNGRTMLTRGAEQTQYFDITAKADLSISALDLKVGFSSGAAAAIDVWVTARGGTYAGNEAKPAAWTRVSAGQAVVRQQLSVISKVTFTKPIVLKQGRYGIAIVHHRAWPNYSSLSLVASFSDAHMQLESGSVSTEAFRGVFYSPRLWNGAVYYRVGSGLFSNFTGYPRSGVSPLQVRFFDQSSSSAPAGVVTWAWDFDNDGKVDSNLVNPVSTYAGGIWSVALRVTDGLHSPSRRVSRDMIRVDQVSASYTSSTKGLTVSFTDTSTGGPTSWAWDVDNDGVVDYRTKNPVHTYPKRGLYVARLTGSNAVTSDTKIEVVTLDTLVMPGYDRTYSAAAQTRGYSFVAPVAFTITGVLVPDELEHGTQHVTVIRTATSIGPVSKYEVLFEAIAKPSDQVLPCQVSFDVGDTVVVIGACGDSSKMLNSYGWGSTGQMLGRPFIWNDVSYGFNLAASPIGGSGKSFQIKPGGGWRIETAISFAVGIDYGQGKDSGLGNGAPTLHTTGLPIIGRSAALIFKTYDKSSTAAALLVGVGRGPVSTPFGALNMSTILIDASIPGAVGAATTLVRLPVPNLATLQGRSVNLQAVTMDSAAPNFLGLSNGVEWIVGAY